MPSTSQKQHDFMVKAAADPEFAKERDIDPEVAQEFVDKDKQLGMWQGEDDKTASQESRQTTRHGYMDGW